jgi:hypothetical protein
MQRKQEKDARAGKAASMKLAPSKRHGTRRRGRCMRHRLAEDRDLGWINDD